MVGLFNIGLESGLTRKQPEELTDLRSAYWLGAVYTTAGIITVLAGQRPSLCLVGFAVLWNIVGSVFALIGIVLYAKDLVYTSVSSMCDLVTLLCVSRVAELLTSTNLCSKKTSRPVLVLDQDQLTQ
ncbi:hypothetical protein INR49_002011, partial [Caranx melampygus]